MFNEYLARVKSGEAKIASGALLPHEIIAALDDDPVVELQWKKMVEEMGKMENLSELSQGPWKGKLIIFSDDPKLHLVGGEGLREKMEFVRGIKRGNHDKNVQKVFDVLLKVAVKGKLRGEEMVKRVFVFSDMGFGKSPFHYEDFKTDYQDIDRMFRENGYGDCVLEPEQLRSQVGQRLPVRQGDARDMEPGRGCTCHRIFQECDESVLGRKWGNFGS
ncbi:hypothetical protein ACS0TY_000307 [Phlomoides rotata]